MFTEVDLLIMSPNGVITRLLLALVLYTLPILGLVSGPITPLFGIMAVIELATALTRFSPIYIILENCKRERDRI